MLRRTLKNKQDALAPAKAAHDELATIQIPEVDQGAARQAQGRIDALKAQQEELASEIRQLEDAERQSKAATESTGKAAAYHKDVLEWLDLAEAFGPDAIGPINKRLAQNALDTGWMQPRITPDIEIEANGRPYALLSESEKWRCDCLIAESISFFSDLKFLCLDWFDVLDLPARGQLIGFLSFMHGDGDLDCALVFGTLKSRPASNETVTALWVEGGEIAEPGGKEEKAA